MKIKLTNVEKVEITKLKLNPLNKHFFNTSGGAHLDNLYRDIEKRGILVPLIAKGDGTLLAGENRLLIAKELKFKKVPVQFVKGFISKDNEKEFIIKDNLLRRHLSPVERKELYKYLIPGFEEKIMITNSKKVGVNASEIAEKTGLNPKTIGYDFAHIRREKRKEQRKVMEIDSENEREIKRYKKSISKMLNCAVVEKGKTLQEFKQITKSALRRLEGI